MRQPRLPLPMVSGSRRRSCRRRAQQAHYPGAHKRIRIDAELPIVVDEQTPSLALSTRARLGSERGIERLRASYLEPAMRRGLPLPRRTML
jgi:hypothetical protein